jgi:hypothetical protein
MIWKHFVSFAESYLKIILLTALALIATQEDHGVHQ